MQFVETRLAGAFRILLEPKVDARGSFTRTFSRDELEERGLADSLEQCNTVTNERAGTLRGVHYHLRPAGEVKFVQCVRGAVFDVLVDLRPESETYGEWISLELQETRPEILYIPKGMGHAYQTLEPQSTVLYFMSEAFVAGTERGFRWDDPALGIPWPVADPILSARDQALPDLDLERHRLEHSSNGGGS
ncbi:MAG: dTDP-4-dehydrorhamnose 3,5-epimerase family protein [Acidimicrobiia bacterium]|nr:dTDP-4-dehydrorhamnose 3,5-epimerase family protein [Acidimicrobiia bacterium]